jgi:Rrf2 family protein
MIKINKKVEYALMVLKHILDKDSKELTTAREVCKQYSIPFDTTAKVMQLMNNAQILDSTKGVKGGYFLKGDLTKINFLDFAELIEGREIGMDCMKLNCSLIQSCNITGPIKRLNQYLILYFKDLSLNDLLTENNVFDLKSLAQKEDTHELV